jgi:hypothetical protein
MKAPWYMKVETQRTDTGISMNVRFRWIYIQWVRFVILVKTIRTWLQGPQKPK